MTFSVLRRFLAYSACASILTLAVGACVKAPEDGQGSASASATSSAPEIKPEPPRLPSRQAGLWEFTTSEQGSSDAPRKFKLCLDKVIDAQLGVLSEDLSADKCYKHAVTQNTDSSWALLSECNMGSGGIKIFSGTIDGDYAQNYKMTLRTQTLDAKLPQMNRVANLTVLAKRVGACEKNQNPGDMVESGVSINLYDSAGKKH